MLRLKGITKDYKVADTYVHALKGINLSFRENEFVSVLGPSGCGKTTLLNILGGLDKYTSGDLIISGRSTKEFRDKDWDVYRNHRVGFIFQSYNLIPHQTVLGNVELALTIAGLSRVERQAKAKAALDKVGLSDQYYKRPNQLSGGQSQRVAIARALVNDPEILLADEPTGALDTTTSVQIMELVKEIAKEKLVIMVTHNPELAKQYSTRTIRLLDGELLSDSNPFSEKDEIEEVKIRKAQLKAKEDAEIAAASGKKIRKEKAKMSMWTAFKLSLQNLFTKKSRTVLTSIAGSIGIIGVSLVLSMSYGIQSFITTMQNDMLSGNPITISKEALDFEALMSGMDTGFTKEAVKELVEDGYVNVNALMDMIVERASAMDGIMVSNTITKEYVDYVKAIPKEDAASVFLRYGLDVTNNIYTDFYETAGSSAKNMSLSTLKQIYTSILKETDYKDYASYITSLADAFRPVMDNEEYILSQYDKLNGKFAREKNEVMIVVDDKTELADLVLAQLGYYTQDEFVNLILKAGEAAGNETTYDKSKDKERFSYDELIGRKFVYYPNDTVFKKVTSPLAAYTPFTYNAYSDSTFKNGVELTVVGILKPKEGLSYGSLSSGFFYTEALVKHILEQNEESQVVKYLLDPANEDMKKSFSSMSYEVPGIGVMDVGITYKYSYNFDCKNPAHNNTHTNITGYVGNSSSMAEMMKSFGLKIDDVRTLSIQQLGGVNMPSSIAIYPTNFEHKELVLAYLDEWNDNDADIEVNGATIKGADREKITYSDNLSIVFFLIGNLINIITIALIGFTALSLVVSCVMIAIITYVSVVERTKEIGVIRSLGGRKSDVSHLFNAETIIIGLVSGLLGIGVTYLVTAIINWIVVALTGIAIAKFPIHYAIIMTSVSVFLTFISGLIPSRSAAKKDPVVALRSE